jgi:hypothetical protein
MSTARRPTKAKAKSPARRRNGSASNIGPALENRPFARQAEAYGRSDRDFVRIPRPKKAPPDSFGLKISGNCLAPRARDGQFAIVESKLPKPGDLAVFWFKGHLMPTIKILSGPIIGYPLHPESECIPIIQVEQLNPPQRYEVRLDKIECIARVHSVVTHED